MHQPGVPGPQPELENAATVMAWAERYLMANYRREPLVPARGQGCVIWDVEGRRYLDMVAGIGVNALGHGHPRVVEAISRQAAALVHVSNLYHIAPQAALGHWLAHHSPFERAFFCNSGAEANEAAIKLARRYAYDRGERERVEVVTALNSFHGRTLGALSATGQARYHQGFEPLVPGFRYVPFNDPGALADAVGPHTAAILLEVVQGEGGVHPARPEFVRAARELADRHGALLIIDEVQTGLGRTGRMFAYEHFGVVPDAVTLGKALAGGIPIGALLARGAAAGVFQPGQHASTFGGNPLACRVALTVLEVMTQERLIERADRLGQHLEAALRRVGERAGHVREVRGLGLMRAVEMEDLPARAVADACREMGLLVNVVGEKALRWLPPLVVEAAELDEAAAILERAIGRVAGDGTAGAEPA